MIELATVLRVVDALEAVRVRVWLFGSWAEELRGLSAPCRHTDLSFLYPNRDFARVDRLVTLDRAEPHARSFQLDGVPVELTLVQRDSEGWITHLPYGSHRWPGDVFASVGRLPVASAAALNGYRIGCLDRMYDVA
jgi:hypothetical protein